MKRTLTILMTAAVVAFAAASASAVGSVLLGSSDPDANYTPGETITLTVIVTANSGESANAALGNITYPDAFININAALNSQTALPGFNNAALDCTTARCRAFNQITPPGPALVPNVAGFLISQTRFIVDPGTAPGTVINFAWQTTPTTQQLNFFGASPVQPGYSVTVVPIPEPTTAVMIGMGLFGLAFAGRRRS